MIALSLYVWKRLSVLEVNTGTDTLKCLNNVLKQGFLPNLSKLSVCAEQNKIHRINTFFREFDPNSVSKLEKLTLWGFIISAADIKILSEKLNSLQVTELVLSNSCGFTGNLLVLLTHSFPTLNTLILSHCDLNSDDLQSLARANVEGKLPQLEHLNISYNSVDISDLFTHSAQWNS